MIRINGIPISAASAESREHLARWWRPECVAYFTCPASGQTQLQRTAYPDLSPSAPPRLGVLHWPAMASRWATFFHVVTGDQLEEIAPEGTNNHNKLLEIAESSTTTTALIKRTMHMLRPRPLATTADSNHTLWLICLVDARYFLQSGYGGASGNSAHISSEFATTYSTWADLIGKAAASTFFGGGGLTIDTIPAAYLTPNQERWNERHAIHLPSWVDAILATVGARLTVPLNSTNTGDARIWRPAAARSAQESNWDAAKTSVILGGQFTATQIARLLPPSVATVFQGRPYPVSSAIAISTGFASVTIARKDKPVTPEIGGLIRPAVIYADTDSTGMTSAEIAAYALQSAQDYYDWQLANRTEATFSGIVPWKPTGGEKAIEYDCGSESGDMYTRIIPWPDGDWNVYGSPEDPRFTSFSGQPLSSTLGDDFPGTTAGTITVSSGTPSDSDRSEGKPVWMPACAVGDNDASHWLLPSTYAWTISAAAEVQVNRGSGNSLGVEVVLSLEYKDASNIWQEFATATIYRGEDRYRKIAFTGADLTGLVVNFTDPSAPLYLTANNISGTGYVKFNTQTGPYIGSDAASPLSGSTPGWKGSGPLIGYIQALPTHPRPGSKSSQVNDWGIYVRPVVTLYATSLPADEANGVNDGGSVTWEPFAEILAFRVEPVTQAIRVDS